MIEAENIDEKRWPARALAGLHRRLEEPRPDAATVPAGEAAAFANGKGAQLYPLYQDRLKTLNAADFGDLLLENHAAVPRKPRRAAPIPGALPLHAGRRVPGHQRRPVSLAAPARAARAEPQNVCLRRRRRPVDLRLARRRGRQHPALREGFSRRRTSSGWSAITARPATSSPPPRISSPTTRDASARRC